MREVSGVWVSLSQHHQYIVTHKMQKPEARRFFEEKWCSHFGMQRDEPERYAQYKALLIPASEEQTWRYDRIRLLAGELVANPSPELPMIIEVFHLVEGQSDIQSLRLLERVVEAISTKLTSKSALIISSSLIGTAAYHYNSGAIYVAMKLNERTVAIHFLEVAIGLAKRAEASDGDVARAEAILKKCVLVKEHFRL